MYKRKSLWLLFLLLFSISLSSCDAFIKNWEQWIDSNIEYECTIVMRYENFVDQSAFERRIQAFELEIVSVKEKDDYITYNLFSHYPVDDQTLYMLCESPTVSVVDGDDNVILTKTDVLSIKMEFSSIAYAFVTEDTFIAFDQKYAGRPVRIIIDGEKTDLLVGAENDNGIYTVNFMLTASAVSTKPLKQMVIAFASEPLVGEVEMTIEKSATRV